jgi:hypothetical protein
MVPSISSLFELSLLRGHGGMHCLPQGYFYFHISSGGLELWHPMIEPLTEPLLRVGKKVGVLGRLCAIIIYHTSSCVWCTSSADTITGLGMSIFIPAPIAAAAHGRRLWFSTDHYERWVVSLYREELVWGWDAFDNLLGGAAVQVVRSPGKSHHMIV